MIHSRLVNFLNRFKFIQVIFSVLPASLIIFFIFFYMLDLSSLVKVLNYNDNVVNVNYKAGTIYEASKIYEDDDSYLIDFIGSDKKVINTDSSKFICSVECCDDKYSKLVFEDGYCMYIFNFSLFESVRPSESDNEYVITIQGVDYTFKHGDEVLKISLNDAGTYNVVIGSDDKNFNLDSIYGIRAVSKNEIEVTSDFSMKFDNLNLNYTTSLPNDSVYVDLDNSSLLKNVSKDFIKNFILGSNIVLVFGSALVFIVLLAVCFKKKELCILGTKYPLIINIFSLLALGFLIILTLFMI